jgi:y4mF family transcriptional regulator
MQRDIISKLLLYLYATAYNMSDLSMFVKVKRKQVGLTQEEFAEKAGVALTVIRKIEQGKENLSLSKVNQVLHLFGHVLGPIKENDATRNR